MLVDHTKKLGAMTSLVGPFLFRNQVTIGAGGPYAGKSRLSLWLAYKLAAGEEIMFGKFAPIKVLYCSERDWDFNSEQLRTLNITTLPENLRFFCVPDIPEKEVVNFEVDPLRYIQGQMKEWKPDLIIFDTAPQFQPTTAGKEQTNSYSFNRKELLKWKRWATKQNCAIFGLYHSPKQNEKNGYQDPFDRVLGSTAILASTVAVCVLERQSEEELRIHFRSHVSRMDTPRSFAYENFEETTPTIMKLTKQEEAVYKIFPTEFTLFPQAIHDISTQLKIQRTNVYRIIRGLVKKGWLEVREGSVPSERFIRKPKTN